MDPYAGNMQDPQSLHKYLYCHANPVNNIDPSGRMSTYLAVGLVVLAILATLTMWRYVINETSFLQTFERDTRKAIREGPGEIRLYWSEHRDQITKANSYGNANLDTVINKYASIYPIVTSRNCLAAEYDLESELKILVSSDPGISEGVVFMPAVLYTSTFTEPDNILILLPSEYKNEWPKLKNANWYDEPKKQNIIFFYAGSSPLKPIGNLYEAVAMSREDSWGIYEDLEVFAYQKF